jgi:predicted kinase
LLDLKSPAPLLLDGKFATNEERDRALKIWRDLHPEYVVEQRKQEKVYQEWLKKHYNKDS